MIGLEWHAPLDEARECVEAAEILLNRVRLHGPTCSAGRRVAMWQAFDWHVDRATRIVEELKGESISRPRRYLDNEARIVFIAASRP